MAYAEAAKPPDPWMVEVDLTAGQLESNMKSDSYNIAMMFIAMMVIMDSYDILYL